MLAVVLILALGGCMRRIKGTITVKGEKQIAFAEMAKISLEGAIKSAVQGYPGKPIKAELKNMDGYLVYTVEIVTAQKTVLDVTVDAGSGNILETGQEKGMD